jgi:DNA modification methylase
MSVRILIGDVRAKLAEIEPESVDCIVTSPPYWGLRDYGVDGQIGMERTLGEHLNVMVEVFDLVRRAMKPEATLWLNYGDCYATKPNGRSGAATKAAGNDDRTFRDKPFSTVGPIYEPEYAKTTRGGWNDPGTGMSRVEHSGRVVAGGTLKPKDLCMIPNRLAIALQDAGWWVRSEIVWGKPNPMPDSSGRYRPSTAHEKIWLLSKSAKCFYDTEAVRMPAAESSVARWSQDIEGQQGSDRANAGRKTNGNLKAVGGRRADKQSLTAAVKDSAGGCRGRTMAGFNDRWDAAERDGATNESRLLRNYEPDLSPIIPPEVWQIATASFSEAHFATFPPALVVPCILAGCPEGGTVLDPFFGAGTTGLVADRLGRDCIGIELNAEYAEIARRRIQADAGVFADISVEHTGPSTRAA